jgi:hypothetical protein
MFTFGARRVEFDNMHGAYSIMIDVGVSLFAKKAVEHRSLKISDIYPYIL